jgi:hypothetical protein
MNIAEQLLREYVEEGFFGDVKDAIVGKSVEELAKTSKQMAALLAMRAQYPNNAELEKRISDLEFRLNKGDGEVMDYDPKTGQTFPKKPLPPKTQESAELNHIKSLVTKLSGK